MSRRLEILLLLLALAIGAALRFLWLDLYPPGWHHDEALMGVMAGEVYRGVQRPIFFPGFAGQEPLYIYLAAGMMALMGGNQDILPLRLTSAIVGLAIVLVAYLLGREMFNRRVGLIAAALLGTNFWQVMSSRNAYRSITQPLLEGLAIYFFWRARRTHSWWWYGAAGAALAGTTYTYLGGRSFPAVLVAFGVWSLLFEGRPPSEVRRRLVVLVAAAVVVAAPIYLYWLTHPGTYTARMDQVFILKPEVNKGQPLLYIADSVGKALQLFTIRGEQLWRYNLPGRPIFVWALVPAFYLGVVFALWRVWRREAAATMLVLWMLVMQFPAVLSWDIGGYTLRAMGLVPALYLFPALGIVAAWDYLARRSAAHQMVRLGAPVAVAVLVIFDAGLTYNDYFRDWVLQFGAAYEDDAHLVAEARYLAVAAHPEREEVIAGSDYLGNAVVSHLAPNVHEKLRWIDGSQAVVYAPDLDRDSHYVFSFSTLPGDLDRYFPPETLVSTERFERGVNPDEPGPPKYVAYRLSPAQVKAQVERWLSDPAGTPLKVNLGGEVELLAAEVPARVTQGERLPVTVVWRVLRPPSAPEYMFFAHLIDVQATMWAQFDGNGYPTAEWRPGDVVVGRYDLAVPAQLAPGKYYIDFGAYDRRGSRRLPVLDSTPERSTAVLAAVKVQPSRPLAQDQMKNALDEQLGDSIKLLGFDLDKTKGSDGRPALDVTLLWKALTKPREDYTVFVQVLSPEGKLVAQSDAMPGGNRFVTSIWEPGELVDDRHRLALDPGLPPGGYRVIAGMYLLGTGQRLPAGRGGDFIELGRVTLP